MKKLALILLAITIVFVLGTIEAFVIMLLWNYVLCAIFTTIPTISFWLAWGVLIMLNIIGSVFKNSRKQ